MQIFRHHVWIRFLLLAMPFVAIRPGYAHEIHFQFRPLATASICVANDETEIPKVEAKEIRPSFAQAGTARYSFGIVGADNFDDITMVLARVSIEMFVIDGVSVGVEGDVGYLGQSVGDDGFGGGVSIRARWHFLRREAWSMYADITAGIFQASVDIPAGSGQFKFYPQAGGGVSLRIGHDQRALFGARWCHLSNARTRSENTGMDGLQLYAMLSVGF